ncbi:unnamed protein product [Didymodactylos carnosus]|uniref:Peptidylamidoglycolate lyase n=1 Tax=Didymodactylos carnosus TaxID=1234261 RepID=A0A8S2DQA5_9BILA|nr:unnamed protein product [Didymodactylos carnosus]CAF3742371.1 unnamed protein product [Didymodactylos carnosus]
MTNRILLYVTSPTIDDGICTNGKWNTNGITKAGSNRSGSSLNQFYFPSTFFMDNDSSIYVADTFNHRIVKWMLDDSASQTIIVGMKGSGNHTDQLSYVHRVVIDKQGTMYICDRGNRRVLRWFKNENYGETILSNVSCWGMALDNDGLLYIVDPSENSHILKWPEGKIVAGGNGQGKALNQLLYPYEIFIDRHKSIFIADGGNHRIVKWPIGATEGILVAGGNGMGKDLHQLHQPMGVLVDQMETVYIAEYGNHRITRWFKNSKSGDIIVGKRGEGHASDQLRNPTDLTFDRHGNLWVADYFNHRIQMFEFDKSSCSSSKF